jgi:hypothetical protein
MEDWKIVDGAAECQSAGGNRSIHLLTHPLTNASGEFSMSVAIDQVDGAAKDGGAGFRIGIRSDINEYRSNCFASGGINIGFIDGQLRIGPKFQPIQPGESTKHCLLSMTGRPIGDRCEITLVAKNADGKTIGTIVDSVPALSILGNIALVNNFETAGVEGNNNKKKKNPISRVVGSRHRFRDWTVSGSAFTISCGRCIRSVILEGLMVSF